VVSFGVVDSIEGPVLVWSLIVVFLRVSMICFGRVSDAYCPKLYADDC
jgi:hypothetical protein